MERVINEIIKKLKRNGFDCDAIIGDKWLTGQNDEQNSILFQFDPLTWSQDKYNQKTLPIKMWVGFPTHTNEDIFQVDVFEKVEKVANLFIYYLKIYEDTDDLQLIELTDSAWEQYFDFAFNSITTSGYFITLNIIKNSTSQC